MNDHNIKPGTLADADRYRHIAGGDDLPLLGTLEFVDELEVVVTF